MLFCLSHPIQYFSPFLKALASVLPINVLYFSDSSIVGNKDVGFGVEVKWDIPLLEGYNSHFIFNWRKSKPMSNHFWDVFNPGVIKEIWNTPHKIVIVNGWVYSSHLLTIFFSKLFGKKNWMRGDNPLYLELQKPKYILIIKKILLTPFFYLFIDKFLYVGVQNKKFYEYYGASNNKLIFAPHAVDNVFFQDEFQKLLPIKETIKAELGVPLEKKIILFTGKYIDQKKPLDLLNAYTLLPKDEFVLIFVGDGNLRTEMESFIESNNLSYVFLTGFINQNHISKFYAIADVFVLCSDSETWGLSVNEAMNFDLPIVVSKACGCSDDLVKHGINGFIYNERDIASLSENLLKILKNPDMAQKMGKMSKQIINEYSIETMIRNII